MSEVTTTQKVTVSVVTSLLILWIAWVSWELYNAKAQDKFHSAIAALAQGINDVNASLDTEIERSKIKDESGFNWLRSVSELAQSNKGRIIALEVKEDAHNNRDH